MRSASTKQGQQWLASGAAVLCLMLQLSASLHYLLVEHAHCVEHGELTHGDHHDHGGAAGIETDEGAPHASAPAGHDDDGHEHCLLATRTRACGEQPPAAVRKAPRMRVAGAALEAATPHEREPLVAAPKTSPPA